MRQIVLDTETTGLEVASGHRIVEVGAIEISNRQITGRRFHHYLNPERAIDVGALRTHGIDEVFLAGKPLFAEIAPAFLDFIRDAELIIHNAEFDLEFLDFELRHASDEFGRVTDHATVIDSLQLARRMHPGARNTLDALCRRYEIENTRGDYHGALLDAHLLSEVYLRMTGGQTALSLGTRASETQEAKDHHAQALQFLAAAVPAEELHAHRSRLEQIDEVSELGCLWVEHPEW